MLKNCVFNTLLITLLGSFCLFGGHCELIPSRSMDCNYKVTLESGEVQFRRDFCEEEAEVRCQEYAMVLTELNAHGLPPEMRSCGKKHIDMEYINGRHLRLGDLQQMPLLVSAADALEHFYNAVQPIHHRLPHNDTLTLVRSRLASMRLASEVRDVCLDLLQQWESKFGGALSKTRRGVRHGNLHMANMHLWNDHIYLLDYDDVGVGYILEDVAMLSVTNCLDRSAEGFLLRKFLGRDDNAMYDLLDGCKALARFAWSMSEIKRLSFSMALKSLHVFRPPPMDPDFFAPAMSSVVPLKKEHIWRFVVLSAGDLRACAGCEVQLFDYDIADVKSFQTGSQDNNYALTLRGGGSVFCRVFLGASGRKNCLLWKKIIRGLNGRGLPPKILRHNDTCLALEFLNGRHLETEELNNPHFLQSFIDQLDMFYAALEEVRDDLPEFYIWKRRRHAFSFCTWSDEAMHLVQSVMQKWCDIFVPKLNVFGRHVVHGDLQPENILVDGSSIALIDLDDCGVGSILEEIARLVLTCQASPQIEEKLLERFLKKGSIDDARYVLHACKIFQTFAMCSYIVSANYRKGIINQTNLVQAIIDPGYPVRLQALEGEELNPYALEVLQNLSDSLYNLKAIVDNAR